MFARLAHASFGLKLNRKYKTIYRGIHYKHHLFSTLSIHDFLAKVKLTACVKCARLYCIVPLILHQYKYVRALRVFCLLHECFCIWNINRSTFQMNKTRLSFHFIITSDFLYYYSKTREYSTKPLQWSSSNAIQLKMMYHRAKKK